MHDFAGSFSDIKWKFILCFLASLQGVELRKSHFDEDHFE